MNARSSRSRLLFAALIAGGFQHSTWVFAQDHVLVLSGGGDPSKNHYSQYLQTRALAEELRKSMGDAQVDVFFGAGNNDVSTPDFADVHGLKTIGGRKVNWEIPGFIRGNSAATKRNVLGYFESSPVLRLMRPEETFYVLVSDHGMPNTGDPSFENNCIDLWGFDPANLTDPVPMRDACLARQELESMLRSRSSAGRSVFAMSQCYSGGFHSMSVKLSGGYPSADPAICGFTAITEDAIASGCTPDVDGPGYQGYERFFTEQLTGLNFVKGQYFAAPKASVREAHYAAELLDMTQDIPTTTSDFYLQRWSDLMERPDFRPRTPTLTASGVRALYLDAASLKLSPADWVARSGAMETLVSERRAFLAEMAQAISGQRPELAKLLTQGSLDELKDARDRVVSLSKAISTSYKDLQAKAAEARYNLVFRRWRDEVAARRVPVLTAPLLEIELRLFSGVEERLQGAAGTANTLKRASLRLLSQEALKDPQGAELLAQYSDSRDELMYAWAEGSGDAGLADAARSVRADFAKVDVLIDRKYAADKEAGLIRRVLRMRQQLAAEVVLGAMNDLQAEADLRGLSDCERTAFHR